MILSDDFIEVIVDFPTEFLDIPKAQEGEYCITPISEDLQIVYMRNPSPEELPLDRFGYRIVPKIYGLARQEIGQMRTRNAGAVLGLEAAGIRAVQRPPLSLLGSGVTIAFIDTGINFVSGEFRDEAGDTRLLALWDQTIQTGAPPEGFLYGTEYVREDINDALQKGNPYEVIPSRDENGHGSAMASVAAGSEIGAAPRADLVVVKLRPCKPYLKQYYRAQTKLAYSETDILQALRYVRRFATPFRKPLVICLGLGTNLGDHTGSSALARFLEEIALDKSTCVLVAGGNEGNRRGHYEGNGALLSNQPAEVELRVGPKEEGLFVEFWGSLPDLYQLRIRTPGGEEIPWSNLSLGQSLSYGFVYERTRISVYTEAVEGSSGEQLTILRFTAPTEGVWRIGVRGVGRVQNGTFHLWLPMEQFLGADTYFLISSPYVTLTEPSMASGVITMTAYNDRNNSFYQEAGRGFSRNNLPKPDLAAPGVGVTTLSGESTGSSMAVAFGSGAAALFLEWAVLQANRPFVTTKEIKNYFIKGATRDPSLNYPNQEWGYGRLNLSDVFTALANASRT